MYSLILLYIEFFYQKSYLQRLNYKKIKFKFFDRILDLKSSSVQITFQTLRCCNQTIDCVLILNTFLNNQCIPIHTDEGISKIDLESTCCCSSNHRVKSELGGKKSIIIILKKKIQALFCFIVLHYRISIVIDTVLRLCKSKRNRFQL